MPRKKPDQISQRQLKDAQIAVATYVTHRKGSAATPTSRRVCREIFKAQAEAIDADRKLTPREWLDLAGIVDEACDLEGAERLFEISEAA